MGDHHVVSVDKLITPDTVQPDKGTKVSESTGDNHINVAESSNSHEHKEVEDGDVADEEQPLIQVLECRICQEEDNVKNLEAPCSCSGSLKYAHRKCVQKWCNEKGDIICEICNQPYQSGYTAPPPRTNDDTAVDISAQWTVSGAPLDLHESRIFAMTANERRLLEEYDEYGDANANGAAFCRSAALILLALLLLRHALYVTSPDGDEDDISTFFSLFLLRAAGFLLPCYIMAWAISILQRRRQRQEEEAIAAGEVAYVIQAGQNGGMHFTIAPGAAVAHHPGSTSIV